MALECTNCGARNPDDVLFCRKCGAYLPEGHHPTGKVTASAIPSRKSWARSHWMLILAVFVTIIPVLVVSLSFSQPWSRIEVHVYNADDYHTLSVLVFIDDVQKKLANIEPGSGLTLGVWSVNPGSYVVALDGFWIWPLFGIYLGAFDGVYEWSQRHEVGPLSTQNVYFSMSYLDFSDGPFFP